MQNEKLSVRFEHGLFDPLSLICFHPPSSKQINRLKL